MLIIAAMVVTFSASAQKKFTYGIKGGVSGSYLSNLKGSSDMENIGGHMDVLLNPSFYAGAFAEWRLTDFFAVAPELIYSGQGGITKVYIGGNDVRSKSNIDYITIPVMAKLYPFKWLSVDFGPQAGLLVAAKTKVEARGIDMPDGTFDSKSNMKTFDFSFGAGFTCNFSKHIFLQARYNTGLTEVFKDKSESGFNNKNHNNQVIQFGLGCRF